MPIKPILILCLTFSISSSLYAQHHPTPESAMQDIFKAAQEENPEYLKNLCPPDRSNDGDTDCLCALEPTYIPHTCEADSRNRIPFEDFIGYFKDARLNGPAKINGDQAVVPFLFGPNASREESMNMILINGNWYLSSF